mmetsp:Transcript_11698/g.15881  ORF Transcript_11698/g.15881 Transcript_11698/m.15881 type:complete len:98 (+) Transcript_11698:52-345(+)
MRALNLKLWQQVHSLELKIRLENSHRKREEKQFRKKLVRLSKYLELKGMTAKKIKSALHDTHCDPLVSSSGGASASQTLSDSSHSLKSDISEKARLV